MFLIIFFSFMMRKAVTILHSIYSIWKKSAWIVKQASKKFGK